mgnify:CR=1 FL=1
MIRRIWWTTEVSSEAEAEAETEAEAGGRREGEDWD